MTQQAPLIPTRHGPDIWRRFRLTGSHHINAAAWEDARAQRHPVGTCRNLTSDKACGGNLDPGQPYDVGRRQFFPTRCGTCGHETAAPGPAPRKKGRR
ncbi:hypothetical protein AB0C02_28025 [Micromonospora sp. NPDC048999]|uniref:hypothetical protein n=1 Tax=Micromonospora sp. NPDC048999 TaxID=3155391 RepID=UPI0033E715D0